MTISAKSDLFGAFLSIRPTAQSIFLSWASHWLYDWAWLNFWAQRIDSDQMRVIIFGLSFKHLEVV